MVPKWLYRLMVQERARTTGLHKVLRYCPANLPKVKIFKIAEEIQYFACANYERARGTSDMPSARYCPTCPYNTDNIRKDADKRLQKSVADFVSSKK